MLRLRLSNLPNLFRLMVCVNWRTSCESDKKLKKKKKYTQKERIERSDRFRRIPRKKKWFSNIAGDDGQIKFNYWKEKERKIPFFFNFTIATLPIPFNVYPVKPKSNPKSFLLAINMKNVSLSKVGYEIYCSIIYWQIWNTYTSTAIDRKFGMLLLFRCGQNFI